MFCRKIYVITKICLDPLENSIEKALSYEPYAFTTSRTKAFLFCKTGKHFTSKDCWVIQRGTRIPQFNFYELKKLSWEKC